MMTSRGNANSVPSVRGRKAAPTRVRRKAAEDADCDAGPPRLPDSTQTHFEKQGFLSGHELPTASSTSRRRFSAGYDMVASRWVASCVRAAQRALTTSRARVKQALMDCGCRSGGDTTLP
jgi:hypothetical protein